MLAEFSDRCDAIEECYEFMLAYAGQGLPSDAGSQSGGQIREFLSRAIVALTGIGKIFGDAIEDAGLEPAEKYQPFLAMLERDASDSLAALQIVLTQPVISS